MKKKSLFMSIFLLLFPVFKSYLLNKESRNENVNLICSQCLSTDSLLKYGRIHQYANKIPKIIHYNYKTAYIPNQYSPYVKQCMEINKDAKFVFWNDFLSYRLMINHFKTYLKLFSGYFNTNIDMLKISDVIRYFILYKFGGIYMDLDTKCQKPFGTVMINNSCILTQEPNEQTRILHNLPYLAMNSLMASIPNHDFFKYVITKLTKADGTHILSQTGPIFLTKVFKAYGKLQTNQLYSLQPIFLADQYSYSPLSKTYLEQYCKKPAGKWQILGCNNLPIHRKLQSAKSKEAVAVHLFMNIAYNRFHIKELDNIRVLTRNITVVVI